MCVELLEAVKDGDIHGVRYLVEKRFADVNYQDHLEGHSALMAAIIMLANSNSAMLQKNEKQQAESHQMLDYLIKRTKLDLKNKKGKTALHICAGFPQCGSILLDKLIQASPNIDVKDIFGLTPLMHAIGAGSLEYVKLFRARGASFKGILPICMAVEALADIKALADEKLKSTKRRALLDIIEFCILNGSEVNSDPIVVPVVLQDEIRRMYSPLIAPSSMMTLLSMLNDVAGVENMLGAPESPFGRLYPLAASAAMLKSTAEATASAATAATAKSALTVPSLEAKITEIIMAASKDPSSANTWLQVIQPPLLRAVQLGDIPLIELLLWHRADVNQHGIAFCSRGCFHLRTALEFSTRGFSDSDAKKDAQLAAFLVSRGTVVTRMQVVHDGPHFRMMVSNVFGNPHQMTLVSAVQRLHDYAKTGQVQNGSLKKWLKKGAHLNQRIDDGSLNTALHTACLAKQALVVKTFANILATFRWEDCLKLLTATNAEKKTVLDVAVEQNDEKLVRPIMAVIQRLVFVMRLKVLQEVPLLASKDELARMTLEISDNLHFATQPKSQALVNIAFAIAEQSTKIAELAHKRLMLSQRHRGDLDTYKLGLSYSYGMGTPRDSLKAYECFRLCQTDPTFKFPELVKDKTETILCALEPLKAPILFAFTKLAESRISVTNTILHTTLGYAFESSDIERQIDNVVETSKEKKLKKVPAKK